jgi:predicted SAM-dependent methyltransferase
MFRASPDPYQEEFMSDYDFSAQFERTKKLLSEYEKLKRLGYERLNFGCGNYPLPGWTNTDGGDGKCWLMPDNEEIVQLDIADCLALTPDNSVQYIASEQFLEHFSRKNAWEICRQWFRVLKPSGVLRIQVPCLDYLCRLYLNQVPFADWESVQKPRRMLHVQEGVGDNSVNTQKDPNRILYEGEDLLPCHVVNMGFYCDGHQYIYDFAYFQQALRLLGFRNVIQCKFGESSHEALRNIDKHDGGGARERLDSRNSPLR